MVLAPRLSTAFPAIVGTFGSRLTTFAGQIAPEDLEGIIGYDPRSRNWKTLPKDLEQLYTHLQRITKPQRMAGILEYVESRFGVNPIILGAFPAISVGVQNPVPYEAIGTTLGAVIAHFDFSGRNRRIVMDGLGRVSAILELLERSDDPNISQDVKNDLKSIISNITIPVVFYTPSSDSAKAFGSLRTEEMQQLFHDFNFRQTALPPKDAIALDHSDPYIQMANQLAKKCAAIRDNGGMEMKQMSLGSKSVGIVVQTNLLRSVRGAMEGSAFQEGNREVLRTPNLTSATFNQNLESLTRFWDMFASAMGDKWADRGLIHLSAPGWQALGVIYNDITFSGAKVDHASAIKKLAEIDWRREGVEWKPIVTTRISKDGSKQLVFGGSGANNRRFLIKLLREKIGISTPSESKDADTSIGALAA